MKTLLAWAIGILALALTPVFFVDMFITVNAMLGPSFGWWAWTVPVATEITFVMLTLLAIQFELLRRPVGLLWAAPFPFMALSVFLNVWGARGDVASIAGHLAVTGAFFAPLAIAKTAVKRMIVTDAEKARAQAVADARAHAYDILRSAFGVTWRFRTPVLLRRRLRTGRLPAAVMSAIDTGDARIWQAVVEAWITSAVTLPSQIGVQLRAATAAPLAIPPAEGAEPDDGTPVPATPEPSATPSRGTARTPARRATGRGDGTPSLIPSKATDEDLAALIVPLLGKGDVSQTKVVKVVREAAGGRTGIGAERAGRVLELARSTYAGQLADSGVVTLASRQA